MHACIQQLLLTNVLPRTDRKVYFEQYQNVLQLGFSKSPGFNILGCIALFTALQRLGVKWKHIPVEDQNRLQVVLEDYVTRLNAAQIKHVLICLADLECHYTDLTDKLRYDLVSVIVTRVHEKKLSTEDFTLLSYTFLRLHTKWDNIPNSLQNDIFELVFARLYKESEVIHYKEEELFSVYQVSRLLFALACMNCTGDKLSIEINRKFLYIFKAIACSKEYVAPVILARLCYSWIMINLKNASLSSANSLLAAEVECMLLHKVQSCANSVGTIGFDQNCFNMLVRAWGAKPEFPNYKIFRARLLQTINTIITGVVPILGTLSVEEVHSLLQSLCLIRYHFTSQDPLYKKLSVYINQPMIKKYEHYNGQYIQCLSACRSVFYKLTEHVLECSISQADLNLAHARTLLPLWLYQQVVDSPVDYVESEIQSITENIESRDSPIDSLSPVNDRITISPFPTDLGIELGITHEEIAKFDSFRLPILSC